MPTTGADLRVIIADRRSAAAEVSLCVRVVRQAVLWQEAAAHSIPGVTFSANRRLAALPPGGQWLPAARPGDVLHVRSGPNRGHYCVDAVLDGPTARLATTTFASSVDDVDVIRDTGRVATRDVVLVLNQ